MIGYGCHEGRESGNALKDPELTGGPREKKSLQGINLSVGPQFI